MSRAGTGERTSRFRAWRDSLAWGVLVTVAVMVTAIAWNLALGRTLHWDAIAEVAAAGLVAMTAIARIT